MRLVIDGKDITDDVVSGLDTLDIEIGLNEDSKSITKGLSTDILIGGDAAQYLYQLFFSNCNSWTNYTEAILHIDLCNISIPFQINSEGAEYCFDTKQIKILLKNEGQDNQAYNKLYSTPIGDDGFIETNDTPIQYYAYQPDITRYILILLISQIQVIFNAIDLIIKTICKIVSLGLGNCETNISGAIFGRLGSWLIGVGRWTVSPLVREIVEYHAGNAGVTFQSSILNEITSPYYNLAIFSLDGQEFGTYKNTSRSEVVRVFKANQPLITTTDLLESLKPMFNADYQIIDGVLYFEELEFFEKIRNISIDYENCSPMCISKNNQDSCAIGYISYQDDAIDREGSKMIRKKYKSIQEYNDPYSPAQKGRCLIDIPYTPGSFMFDELTLEEAESKKFFTLRLYADVERYNGGGFLDDLIGLNNATRRNDLVLSATSVQNPKLMIFESNFNRKDAKVIKRYIKNVKRFDAFFGQGGSFNYYSYNEPLTVDVLITRFLYKVNPRLRSKKQVVTNELTLVCSCDMVSDIINSFQKIYINTTFAKVIPESAKISISRNVASIVITESYILCEE